MGILIKVKKIEGAPKSIDDLKKMGDKMMNEELPDPLDDMDDMDEERVPSEGDVEAEGKDMDNPQDRNSDIDDVEETYSKIDKQKFKMDKMGMLGMSCGEDDNYEDKNESLKMFLRGLLGMM